MKRNFLLTIEYDGTLFHGWQRQPDAITVQGYLESTLSRLFKKDIVVNGTSRTDAGVHAYGQRATFSMESGIPADRLARVINNALDGRQKGPFAVSPVRIVAAEEKPEEFHARFDSRGKKYIYKIRNLPGVDIFRRNYVYHVSRELDVDAMRTAAEYLKGTHDFKSFEASGGTERETTVRTIYDIEIRCVQDLAGGTGSSTEREMINPRNGADAPARQTVCSPETLQADPADCGAAEPARAGNPELHMKEYEALQKSEGPVFAGDLEIHVSGDGFLYNMVRIITGTLVDVGCGRIAAEQMPDIIAAKDRARAGHTAPPYGLYLAEVYY